METKELLSNAELLGDIVLVEQLPNDATTKSGLILPEIAAQDKTGIRATVLNIGSKFVHKDEVKIGDIVMVSKYLGTALDKNDERLRIYDGEDVIAIVTED